jgi:hypothetical protein
MEDRSRGRRHTLVNGVGSRVEVATAMHGGTSRHLCTGKSKSLRWEEEWTFHGKLVLFKRGSAVVLPSICKTFQIRPANGTCNWHHES